MDARLNLTENTVAVKVLKRILAAGPRSTLDDLANFATGGATLLIVEEDE